MPNRLNQMHELKCGTMLNLHATNARYRILEMRLADNVKLTELLQLYWVYVAVYCGIALNWLKKCNNISCNWLAYFVREKWVGEGAM